MNRAEVELRIGADEAVVPFELLHRWLDDRHGAPIRGAIDDDAELWAWNGLSAALERTLVERFRPE